MLKLTRWGEANRLNSDLCLSCVFTVVNDESALIYRLNARTTFSGLCLGRICLKVYEQSEKRQLFTCINMLCMHSWKR